MEEKRQRPLQAPPGEEVLGRLLLGPRELLLELRDLVGQLVDALACTGDPANRAPRTRGPPLFPAVVGGLVR